MDRARVRQALVGSDGLHLAARGAGRPGGRYVAGRHARSRRVRRLRNPQRRWTYREVVAPERLEFVLIVQAFGYGTTEARDVLRAGPEQCFDKMVVMFRQL